MTDHMDREQNNDDVQQCIFSDAARLWVQSQKPCWKPGAYTAYNQLLVKYIIPYLGNTGIDKITAQTMENFAAFLMMRPKEEKGIYVPL